MWETCVCVCVCARDSHEGRVRFEAGGIVATDSVMWACQWRKGIPSRAIGFWWAVRLKELTVCSKILEFCGHSALLERALLRCFVISSWRSTENPIDRLLPPNLNIRRLCACYWALINSALQVRWVTGMRKGCVTAERVSRIRLSIIFITVVVSVITTNLQRWSRGFAPSCLFQLLLG